MFAATDQRVATEDAFDGIRHIDGCVMSRHFVRTELKRLRRLRRTLGNELHGVPEIRGFQIGMGKPSRHLHRQSPWSVEMEILDQSRVSEDCDFDLKWNPHLRKVGGCGAACAETSGKKRYRGRYAASRHVFSQSNARGNARAEWRGACLASGVTRGPSR